MSFIIVLHINEGLVFASDSRITYQTSTKGVDGKEIIQRGVHISDTNYKTFLSKSNVGISICGDASIDNKPIAGFIESFISEHQDDDVDAISKDVIHYCKALSPNLDCGFLIGGYVTNEIGQRVQKLYQVNTLSDRIDSIDTSIQGAVWDGETDVMSRILTEVFIKRSDGSYILHSHHSILWQYLSLQDAIDFARYAVQTTAETIRFQKRVKTVGGPIDILVIKPETAIWIKRKELK